MPTLRSRAAPLAAAMVIAAVTLWSIGLVHAQTESTRAKATAPAPAKSIPAKKGHVPSKGVNYYYEIHGKGEPLLLLHGGLGSTAMFGPVLSALARTRQVIGVDLHGHGRTILGEREISLVDMGDDMAALLRAIGYRNVDALGYSLGGGVAFRFAVHGRIDEGHADVPIL